MANKYYTVSWDQLHRDAKALAWRLLERGPWRGVVAITRGGLIPAVAYVGPAFAGLVSGSVVVETVFQLPGLGQHFIKAIETSDEPVILACVMLYGSLIILANFLTDLVSLWLNPRLRTR